MTLSAIPIVVPKKVHRAKQASNFQMPPLDKTLLGPGLKGSIELIDQRLNYRFEQLAGGLEDQFSELPFEGQQLLLRRVLI